MPALSEKLTDMLDAEMESVNAYFRKENFTELYNSAKELMNLAKAAIDEERAQRKYKCGYCKGSTRYDSLLRAFRCNRCGRSYYPECDDDDLSLIYDNDHLYHKEDWKRRMKVLKRVDWLKKRKEIAETLSEHDSTWSSLSTQGKKNLVDETMSSLGYRKYTKAY